MCGALPLFLLYVLMTGLEHIYRVYILTRHGQSPLIINSCISISVRRSYSFVSGMSDYVRSLSKESPISADICYS